MEKLESYGIKGNVHKWIKSFLAGRSQVAKVNGTEYNSPAALSEIPQGSVLGQFCLYYTSMICLKSLWPNG